MTEDDALLEVQRLALLPELSYQMQRGAAAKALGITLKALDRMVIGERPGAARPVKGEPMAFDPAAVARAAVEQAGAATEDKDDSALLSETALARLFVGKFRHSKRYVPELGKWYHWTGTKWEPDGVMAVWNDATKLAASISRTADSKAHGRTLASSKTITALVTIARAIPPMPILAERFDLDPWMLNTPGGLVDLRSGAKAANDPSAYCSKITAVAPSGQTPHAWLDFIDQITLGDADLAAYLQRVAGYCLTGSTRDQALFFLYGTGGNGKGVFVRALFKIMHDYAVNSPIDTFTEAPGNQQNHPTELARLRGARLVTTSETEEGRRWAEARIKELTGGDPITARFMRQDHFTFVPAFKLLVSGNNKPGLKGVDDAIRRRMNLVPFNLQLAPGQKDMDLDGRLRDEWGGILGWMIAGTGLYLEHGLAPPAIVAEATLEYLESEDAIGQWIEQCCVIDRALTSSAGAVFGSWKTWCDQTGEFVGSQKRLTKALEKRGISASRTSSSRTYVGLSVISDMAGGPYQ